MAKVWRNSEGREFPCDHDFGWLYPDWDDDNPVGPETMEALGYELVEKEELEEEFEATAQLVLLYASVTEDAAIVDERLDPGELYSVRKVKR